MLIYFIRLIAGLVLLIGLFLDARQQPSSYNRRSWVGCLANGNPRSRVSPRVPPTLVLTHGPSGVTCHPIQRGSDSPTYTRHRDPSGDVEYVVLSPGAEHYSGFWAITDHVVTRSLFILTDYPVNSELESPPQHIRAAAALWLRDNGWVDPVIYARLRTADVRLHRTVPGGWTHTIIALSLLVVALVLIPWKQTFHAVRRWLAAPRPGLCKACGYDLEGLRGNVCPECGGTLERRDRTASPVELSNRNRVSDGVPAERSEGEC